MQQEPTAAPAPAARSGCAWRRSQKAALWDGGVPGDYMAIFLADMPPLPPRPPKQHAQISWLAKGGRFYLFSLSRRSRDETSFGSCSGGAEVAPLALLASLGLTTTLVHEGPRHFLRTTNNAFVCPRKTTLRRACNILMRVITGYVSKWFTPAPFVLSTALPRT